MIGPGLAAGIVAALHADVPVPAVNATTGEVLEDPG